MSISLIKVDPSCITHSSKLIEGEVVRFKFDLSKCSLVIPLEDHISGYMGVQTTTNNDFEKYILDPLDYTKYIGKFVYGKFISYSRIDKYPLLEVSNVLNRDYIIDSIIN